VPADHSAAADLADRPDPAARLDLTPVLAVHDAVRRDLVRLVQVLGGTAPVTAGRAAALRDHWVLLAGVLAAHEHAEDTVLWPALVEAAPAAERVVAAAVAQHAGLDDAMATAGRLLDELVDPATPADREEVAAAVERAAVLADHHFGLEEDRLLPLVDRALPTRAWEAFVSAWRRDVGPGGGAAVLPFLVEGARPDRVASLLAALDEGQRAAYAGEWRPAHDTRVALLW
jgi:hypothetical protein